MRDTAGSVADIGVLGARSELRIAAASTGGFELGANCETYGLYPFAGPWQGAPWERHVSVEDICDNYFGLVRALLSPDARLRVTYRRDQVETVTVELRSTDGWTAFEKHRDIVVPLGSKREAFLQNHLLPSRFPFEGMSRTHWGVYLWDLR